MPPGSQQGALDGIRTLLPRPTWLDVFVRIVGPDPASFIHAGSDTESGQRRWVAALLRSVTQHLHRVSTQSLHILHVVSI